ncbi:MAG TPA: 1,2-phenylacetyl-CoA epoxidase subunit PaaC [Puia sp.]|nr:1,2-phenylacetyl-CoA epoxidase subunit PaaC [Puia sp.]
MHNRQALIDYTLHLADNSLILGHRNSEWTGYGPVLEQDIAISNIALDLIGQARNFYQYASGLINQGDAGARAGSRAAEVTEDSLAYLRDAWDFKNCLLAEQDNGDWAKTILRQFFFSAWQFYLYGELQQCENSELAAVGEKALKETTYHLRWSSEWMIRLGDGTEESHARMVGALDELWKFTGELFMPSRYEQQLIGEGILPDLSLLRNKWDEKVKEIFAQANLSIPEGTGGVSPWMQSGGKEGRHTEQLGYILAEMQFLQRAYPGCEW